MASNTSHSIESVVTDESHFKRSPSRSHRSFTTSTMTDTQTPTPDPHSALFHGHDHHHDEDFLNKSTSQRANQMVTPFLTQHIPHQYNPLGGGPRPQNASVHANTKYCYRHRPDLLCRRQADEPSMEQLQEELSSLSQADQQGIAHVWSLFSAAPSKHRNLMLQGVLAQCCFPQLSFISSSVRNLI
jgi:F-box/WD-40 domain protein MET30